VDVTSSHPHRTHSIGNSAASECFPKLTGNLSDILFSLHYFRPFFKVSCDTQSKVLARDTIAPQIVALINAIPKTKRLPIMEAFLHLLFFLLT
jgi:hypothetical protein